MRRQLKRLGRAVPVRSVTRSMGAVTLGAAALAAPDGARAVGIETGVPDLQLRFDNKIGFTAGLRLADRDTSNAANPAKGGAVASEYFTDQHHLYTTRFDLYSELDLRYKNDHGFRLSGAAWYDPKFPDQPNVGPAGVANSAFGPSGEWPSDTRRYYAHGGEWLDAFAFTRLELGSVPLYVKAGRTAVVWGESIFGGVGGLNTAGYAQSPVDGRKSTQTPSASLKETTLPITQLNLVANLSETASISLYENFEFRGNRVPASGTYYGFNDGVAGGQNLTCAQALPYRCYPYGPPLEAGTHDWGVMLKTRPAFLDAAIGIVYRQFGEKAPWYGVWDVADNLPLGLARSVYGRNTKLFGLTANATLFDVSWSAELNYRKDAALVSDFSALAPVALGGRNGPGGRFSTTPTEGARGNTVHALVNGTAVFGKAAWWDTFTLVGELSAAHLTRVTRNASLFAAEGADYAPVLCNAPASAGGAVDHKVAACADRTAYALGVLVDPTTFNVLPSIDLDIPIFAQFNIGNSPVNSATSDKFNTYSIGLRATWNTAVAPQIFQLNFLKFTNRRNVDNPRSRTILGAPYYDRDQIQFTYTASF